MTASSSEDVVQEVLLKAWKDPGLGQRDDGAARAWLFTASRNLIIDRWRSAASRHEQRTEDPLEQSGATATSVVLDRWLIADALSRLSVEHRAVIVAAYYEGRSVADISARLRHPGRHREVAAALRVAQSEVDLAGEGGDPAVNAVPDQYLHVGRRLRAGRALAGRAARVRRAPGRLPGLPGRGLRGRRPARAAGPGGTGGRRGAGCGSGRDLDAGSPPASLLPKVIIGSADPSPPDDRHAIVGAAAAVMVILVGIGVGSGPAPGRARGPQRLAFVHGRADGDHGRGRRRSRSRAAPTSPSSASTARPASRSPAGRTRSIRSSWSTAPATAEFDQEVAGQAQQGDAAEREHRPRVSQISQVEIRDDTMRRIRRCSAPRYAEQGEPT